MVRAFIKKMVVLLFQGVLHRLPLHSIAQVVNFEDSFGRSSVALKIGQVNRKVYDCYLFRCENEVIIDNLKVPFVFILDQFH